jgi:flavin reductase (DIM6/NTAB) family NADH-FMN oxidoreductase RutF/DNA-binding GntR family transcriptional regulator
MPLGWDAILTIGGCWSGVPPVGYRLTLRALTEDETMTSADTVFMTGRVDQAIFRDVIGRFASGVTIITTRTGDQDYGTTASAVSSLSMEPPMLLICLNKTSETRQAIIAAGWFAVNILSESQTALAYAFAKKSPDKFQGAHIVRGVGGVPLIPGALAQLECLLRETATGGTHTVFMGEVQHASATEGAPLTYYRGQFGRFAEMLQDAAYRTIRGLVVSREISSGTTVDVERLARELEFEQAHVFYALTKLTADGLVERYPDGELLVKPLDVRMAHEAIDARCAIEIAVVDKVSGAIDDGDVETLRGHARAADAAAKGRPADIEELLRAGHAFHEHFIGLLGNEALQSFFRRLDIGGIWARAAPDIDRRGKTSASYLGELVEACASGDSDKAKQTLYAHAAKVKDDAREVIALVGGKV